MPSLSFARPSQPAAAQANSSALSFRNSPSTEAPKHNDPLQPLRAMADRVGKEVEKFAERVDHWHIHGNDSARTKYQTTVKLVGKFRDVAETQVKDLRRAHEAEHKKELDNSVRRRIQDMAEAPNTNGQTDLAQSFASTALSNQSSSSQEQTHLQNLRQWQAELATWELVLITIDQYITEPETNPSHDKHRKLAEVGGDKRYSPNSEIWDRFVIEDDQAREKALVLRWLEQTARNERSGVESITEELEAHSGRGSHTWTSGWLDTKGKIKQVKRLEGTDQPLAPGDFQLKATSNRTQDLTTHLDPDGPARQKRVLEQSDEYYERALWMVCYEMLRRGLPWNEVCEWAQERNEAWRGVSVGAACESHPNGGPNVSGPSVGYLFRRMCFYTARGARTPYERAVYGLLSGDLKQVQVVCRTWDDHLHAYYNALLLSRFDGYLLKNYPNRVNQKLNQKFVFQDAVANIGPWNDASRKVIDLLRQQKATAKESTHPIKLIQGALIAITLEDLLLKVGTGIADMLQNDDRPTNLMLHPDSERTDPGPKPVGAERNYTADQFYQDLAADPHALRILVHIFLLFKNGLGLLNFDDSADMSIWVAMDNVIVAYIELLRLTKRISLIPLYAAQLASERAAHCLARVLPDIRNTEEQKKTVGLFQQYGIDVGEVIAESYNFSFKNSGFTQFHKKRYPVIASPIARFKVLESSGSQDFGLWPGYRIRREFSGSSIESRDETIIETLQWYYFISHEYEQTFDHLTGALTIFLLNGRLGAAEKVINDLSVESLSLSRTEALCGYPFDITQPGVEHQDETQLHDHRSHLTAAALRNAIKHDSLPNARKHSAIVQRLRDASAAYYNLQLMVRILVLFREWRNEEEELIKIRTDQSRQYQDGSGNKKKADMSHVKDILESIEMVFSTLISGISRSVQLGGEKETDYSWKLKCAYIPEIVLAYISVLQTSAFFMQRDSAVSSGVKAVEIANLVADQENAWLQEVFLQTGRMSELVDALAMVSKAMLKLSEHEPKKTVTKKRGSKGETLRIWDLNAKDRV
ncbi:107-domain-containing protein [Ampelomyces quisqualis]|uniref:Nuclear pore complex protein n=1 Tax=Ampelomyces quisqualis TaxID=50730 RepID=A0A6A5QVI5_AMPQU|nr:107-domain-containing protein [Ampelomyces quisqualis]